MDRKLPAKKSGGKLETFVKSIDIFGERVQPKYENEAELKTRCGGVCTIIIYALIIYITLHNFLLVASLSNYDLRKSRIFYSPEELSDIPVKEINTEMKNFKFGFKHEGHDVDMFDNQYVRVRL